MRGPQHGGRGPGEVSPLLPALLAAALAAPPPRLPELVAIDLVPGKMGAVAFKHAEHLRKRRPDGAPLGCRDCHHNLDSDAPPPPGADLRCGGCHAPVGQPERSWRGKAARPLARLKPDGAIAHDTVLFHDYCRDCHRRSTGAGRMLGGCKVCHERGVGSDVIHGRYDATSDRPAATASR